MVDTTLKVTDRTVNVVDTTLKVTDRLVNVVDTTLKPIVINSRNHWGVEFIGWGKIRKKVSKTVGVLLTLILMDISFLKVPATNF